MDININIKRKRHSSSNDQEDWREHSPCNTILPIKRVRRDCVPLITEYYKEDEVRLKRKLNKDYNKLYSQIISLNESDFVKFVDNKDPIELKTVLEIQRRPDAQSTLLMDLLFNCTPYYKIELLIQKIKPNLNLINAQSESILHLACQQSNYNLQFIEVLLQHGADPDLLNKDSKTAMVVLLKLNLPKPNIDIDKCNLYFALKLFIYYKMNVNIIQLNNHTLLHYLCYKHDVDIRLIELLLQNGANPNILSTKHSTPLYSLLKSHFINTNEIDIIKLFIKWNADLNIQDTCNSNRSIHKFQFRGHSLFALVFREQIVYNSYELEAIQLLIDNGAGVNHQEFFSKNTILSIVCKNSINDSNLKCVELLLKNKANGNLTNINGYNCFDELNHNCLPGNVEISKLLLKSGVSYSRSLRDGLFSIPSEILEIIVTMIIRNKEDPFKTLVHDSQIPDDILIPTQIRIIKKLLDRLTEQNSMKTALLRSNSNSMVGKVLSFI